MIDIKLLREHRELFYENCRKRFMDPANLVRFFSLDESWRQKLRAVNDLKHAKNEISLRIADLVKTGHDTSSLKQEVRKLTEDIGKLEQELASTDMERTEVVRSIPNLVHESVPVCKGDENNAVVRYSGNAVVHESDVQYFKENTPKGSAFTITQDKVVSHVDILEKLNLIDLARAGKTAGARFYYLKNRLVKLEMALMNYAVDFLSERGFTIVEPPFMLNYAAMDAVTD
ncbi:seryl-tRNA synthetase, partial [mine drainage metagenome]